MAFKLKRGDKVYLKKTGEKFYIQDIDRKKKKNRYTIIDEYGTGFYGIDKSEFKEKK